MQLSNAEMVRRARELRARQTKAESLLWRLLRNRRLCGLKFRRQFAIGCLVVDFACVEQRFAVEIDGGYHDALFARDSARQRYIESAGWRVLRYANEDVLHSAELVGVAIAKELGLAFAPGTATRSSRPPK